jgi:hypothetical protein
MKSRIGPLVCALLVAAVIVSAAVGARDRAANCGGYCLYTGNHGGWSFDGQFHARPNAATTRTWLRLSNTVDWKLTLGPQFAGTPATAEIHLGTPRSPGRLLAVLCARCRSGSHGTIRLNDGTLATIFAGTNLGGGLSVHAYVVLHTSKATLRRQLFDA